MGFQGAAEERRLADERRARNEGELRVAVRDLTAAVDEFCAFGSSNRREAMVAANERAKRALRTL